MRNSYNKPELKSLYYEEEVEKIPSLDGKTIAITGQLQVLDSLRLKQ